MIRWLLRLLATRTVTIPADQLRIVDAEDHGHAPTREEQAIIDGLRDAELPEVTPAMRDRAIARFAAEFPPPVADEAALIRQVWEDTRPPAPTVAQLEQIRDVLAADEPRPQAADMPTFPRTRLSEERLQAARERVFVPQPRRRWPDMPRDIGISRPRWQPPNQSDDQPTTPPSAPLPPGTASGPGFVRYDRPGGAA